ncbi:hypothetical protein ABGF49_07365 [Helcococcus ovis]|uniref:hypothetical protein n=1 Tax=Helcococcus TaxID=31983 RepID=UPI0038BCAA69
MKYVNKNTGAIIETSSKLAGAWVEYDPSAPVEEKKDEVQEVVHVEKEESKKDLSSEYDMVTVADIKKELDAFGIEYTPKMKKKELWDLMLESR